MVTVFRRLWYPATRRICLSNALRIQNYGKTTGKLDKTLFKRNGLAHTKSFLVRFLFQWQESTFENPGENLSIKLKKKPKRTKDHNLMKVSGAYDVTAYATSEEIDLEDLMDPLRRHLRFEVEHYQEGLDFVKAAKSSVPGCEPHELFIFREGAVVMWNTPEDLTQKILLTINQHEQHKYIERIVKGEAETFSYRHNYDHEENKGLSEKGKIIISAKGNTWEKYAASHALASAVKLAVWEQQLEKYISDIEYVTEDLKYGNTLSLSQGRVLRKHGALFALRHVINLSSCLMSPPDLPHSDKKLNNLYTDLIDFYAINQRLKLVGEKMKHCLEIVSILAEHLRDKHGNRLEWMVIALIVVELGFQTFFLIDMCLG